MTLDEDPDAIWMTGPPPRLPFVEAGLWRRVVISVAVPPTIAGLVLVFLSTWGRELSSAANAVVVLAAIAVIAAALVAVWAPRRRRVSFR